MKCARTPLVVTLLFVILALPCCNGGFDDCHNTIYFTNNSDKPIYAVSTLKKGFLNFDPTNEEYAADFKVRPGKTIKVKIGITLQCWEQTLEQTGGYLYIYVYDAEYLEDKKTDWLTARDNPKKEYVLNVKDLQRLEWKVAYP
ncbi:MAG TPA: hypothetical protein GXZ56_08165 [Bacteroidales bacterium]|mgnify:FL=1|jgi:hypothetical protein|nr:hypothetical protein [Bacteroidales bacterium]